MTTQPPLLPPSLPLRRRPHVVDPPMMRVETERVRPQMPRTCADRLFTMRRQFLHPPRPVHESHGAWSSTLDERRIVTPEATGSNPVMPPSEWQAEQLVDQLAAQLVNQTGDLQPSRPAAFLGPSWCTHIGVTVPRADRRACLRCGKVL